MKNAFDTCIKIVNFIRKQNTNHRIFKLFCDNMSNEYCILLYHTNIQRLSRGLVMTRFFKLRETIKLFLQYKNSDLVGKAMQWKAVKAMNLFNVWFILLMLCIIKMSRTCHFKDNK